MNTITSYSFIIIAVGTSLLGIASSMVGVLAVNKGQSLIGDAVGHSALPGVILAFMLFGTKNPGILILGAAITATLAYFLIEMVSSITKVSSDAMLAIVLSGFFGGGLMLRSHISGNPSYSPQLQAGLSNYIFGQAAYIMKNDVYYIAVISIITILLIVLFYKEFKVFIFDEEYAYMIGLNLKLLRVLLMFLIIMIIASGLKLVGAILISSFLIIPTITASLWTDKFKNNMVISSGLTLASTLTGSYLSSLTKGLSTGATIILIMGALFLISSIVSPKGILRRRHLNV